MENAWKMNFKSGSYTDLITIGSDLKYVVMYYVGTSRFIFFLNGG